MISLFHFLSVAFCNKAFDARSRNELWPHEANKEFMARIGGQLLGWTEGPGLEQAGTSSFWGSTVGVPTFYPAQLMASVITVIQPSVPCSRAASQEREF